METFTCNCTACKGITFTAPAGFMADAKDLPTVVHNYAQMVASPVLGRAMAARGLVRA